MWDEPDCPLSQAYMDDLTQINTVVDRAPQITVPWLLVHGDEDDVVPIEDSHDILERVDGQTQLITLEGASHVFSDEYTPVMVEKVVAWLKTQLAN